MNHLVAVIHAVCAIAFLVWTSGCSPVLTAQSFPPPGRVASFVGDDGHYDLELSQGVAIAISCYHDGACRDVVVSTADATIADVHGASIGEKTLAAGAQPTPYVRPSFATTSGFVVVGKGVGKTKVKVETAKGAKTINVHVIAPPGTAPPAVVAR